MREAKLKKPVVTIVLPTYNRARYLRESIDSCRRQTYENLELIVVDDASTDNTAEVLNSIPDERVVVLRNEQNLGAARSRNVALGRARGEFIALMDSDDRCAPGRLARQVECLQGHGELAAVSTRAKVIDEGGRPTGELYRTPCDPAEIREEALRRPGIPAHAAAMIRTGALQTLGGYRPFRYVEDYDLFLRMTDKEPCIAVIPEYLYELRRHGDQETHRDLTGADVRVFLVSHAARRRRAGRPDPLEGLDYEQFLALVETTKQGRGYWGRRWRAEQDWGRASQLWDRRDHWGAAKEMLKILCYYPTYGPMWRRIGETVAQRLRFRVQ